MSAMAVLRSQTQESQPAREEAQAPSQESSNAAMQAGGGASSDGDADALGLTAEFEASRALTRRVDAAVARSAADPRGALGELLAIHQDPAFPQVARGLRARVLYDIGASYNAMSRPDDARIYLEAALAGGGLDPERTDRATEAIRRTRGGASVGALGAAAAPRRGGLTRRPGA